MKIPTIMLLLSALSALPLHAEILGSWPEGGENTLTPNASPRKILKIASVSTSSGALRHLLLQGKAYLQGFITSPFVAAKRLPLEGKLSALLTDEVSLTTNH